MSTKLFPLIVIDGIFFQINVTGIARVWQTLLKQWLKSGFANHIVVLDRGKTAPKIEGINYYEIESYDYRKSGADTYNLQSICDRLQADVFISTYYTTPINTPSVFLGHDLIPEVLGMDLNAVEWQEKHLAILHASKYITVSLNTAKDLNKIFPHISLEEITVAYPAVGEDFYRTDLNNIDNFKSKYNITKPYFLFVGTRLSYDRYKNAILLFRAFNQFPQNKDIAIVCVGGDRQLEPELAALMEDEMSIHLLRIDDDELGSAYSGAIALVYPSRYEGFGLPILEAMACGCPVITCRNSSLPEVAGEAAWYISEFSIEEMLIALEKVQMPDIRDKLIKAGKERVKQFSWSTMADTIAEVLTETAREHQLHTITSNDLLWRKLRKEQKQKQELKFLYKDSCEKIHNLENLQIKLENLQMKLKKSQALIEAMESSKFWKMRKSWFALKKFLGVKTDDQ
jgi:glycosyltransferase involved in cell wall biosynthesis